MKVIPNPLLHSARDFLRRFPKRIGAGDVHKGLINGKNFHERGVSCEVRKNLLGGVRIFSAISRNKTGKRTKEFGAAQRHAGLYSIFTGLVACRKDNAGFHRMTHHKNRLAAKCGISRLLRLGKKGVQIKMNNDSFLVIGFLLKRGLEAFSDNQSPVTFPSFQLKSLESY